MRTTLTLEPDVALKLKKKMAEEKLTLKDAVNRALRAGLEASVQLGKARQVQSNTSPSFGFQPWHRSR